jgi:hypothetical protein
MGLNTKYAKEIHDQYGYLAAWLPTANMQVGDIGTIKDGIFEKTGNLKDLGISFTSQADPQTGDYEYASTNAVSIEFKAAGSAPVAGGAAKADANVGISFTRPDAVLFQASGCKTLTLSDLPKVTDAILSQYRAGKWPSDWVVVTDVVSSAATTVLISSGTNAHIDLSVTGNLGTSKASLANADAKFEITKSSAIGTRIVGAKKSTPLFKASGIKTSFFHDPVLMKKAIGDDAKLIPLDFINLVGPTGDRAG